MFQYPVGDKRQAHGIALPLGQIGQARSEDRGIPQFVLRRFAYGHRGTQVEHDVQVDIGLGVVLLDIESIVPAEELPVQMPQIVAGHVFAMRNKVDPIADVRTAMQAVQETFDDPLRHKLQVFHAGRQLRICQVCGSVTGPGSRNGLPCAADVETPALIDNVPARLMRRITSSTSTFSARA